MAVPVVICVFRAEFLAAYVSKIQERGEQGRMRTLGAWRQILGQEQLGTTRKQMDNVTYT